MKKGIIFNFIFLLFVSVIISGCGSSGIKKEKELKEDLADNGYFSTVEGTEISDLTVIKRMTDKKSKEDKVYVSVELDHEAATESRAYVMNYSKYNSGWLLDSVEPYYGDEAEWIVIPKKGPEQEKITKEYYNYAAEYIEYAIYETTYSAINGNIFWEKLKTAKNNDNNMYQCAVEIDSEILSENVMYLEFYFDSWSYEWYLTNVEFVRAMY